MYKQILDPKYQIGFSDIDAKFLQELEYYMINESQLIKKCPYIIKAVPESRIPCQRGKNTISGYFKKVRSFVLWAKGEGLITSDPFRKFKITREVYGTPYYITLEERHQIEQADLSSRPKLAIQRDIFVFHCCLGCRVSDLRRLTTANVINGVVHYIARKTKTGNPKTIKIPLNETALAIVEKYADSNRKSLLPFISDQKYNYAIKEIFKLAGVTRNVVIRNSLTGEEDVRPINEIASSHIARRTFVGNIFKKFKDQSLVSELSGHVPNSQEFARYREIDMDLKREMVSAIE
jgi:integrase